MLLKILKDAWKQFRRRRPDLRDCGCLCQECGIRYKVDLIIPDELWSAIGPYPGLTYADGGDAGMLCGSCIMQRIEDNSDFDGWELVSLD